MQAMPQQIPQFPRMPRMKPFQGYYQDPSYFNAMTYPQLMARYPNYRYPQHTPEASNIHPIGITMKPSQLVVHLNLYPKNKTPYKRSSTEEEISRKKTQLEPSKTETKNATTGTTSMPLNINFNVNTGNGHPENIHHHVNLPRDPYQNYNVTSDYKSNYYYDENEDDRSLHVAPSLVYNNIHRERPIHMMLRNTTTTRKPPKKMNNHKHTYQTIERPRKQAIRNEPRNFIDIHH